MMLGTTIKKIYESNICKNNYMKDKDNLKLNLFIMNAK